MRSTRSTGFLSFVIPMRPTCPVRTIRPRWLMSALTEPDGPYELNQLYGPHGPYVPYMHDGAYEPDDQ
eukprot:9466778-Pyramimonas_sp.AAC.1